MNQPEILSWTLECSLVLSSLSSFLPVQPACHHLATASLHLSQPSDLCVNRQHRQLTLTQHASAHLQGKLSTNAFSEDFGTINGGVSEYCKCWCLYSWIRTTWKVPFPAIKTASEPFYSEAGNLQAAGRRSKPLLTDSANTKIYSTHQELLECFLSGLLSWCGPILMGVY